MSDREKYRKKFASYPDLVNLIQFLQYFLGIVVRSVHLLCGLHQFLHLLAGVLNHIAHFNNLLCCLLRFLCLGCLSTL